MPIEPVRVVMRIELVPYAKKQLIAAAGRLGMTQVATNSRLVEWLCQQSDVIQAAILGLYPEDIRMELPFLILRCMAARQK